MSTIRRAALLAGYCFASFLALAVDPMPFFGGAAVIVCFLAGPLCLVIDYQMFRLVRTGRLLPGLLTFGVWACYGTWVFVFAFVIFEYIVNNCIYSLKDVACVQRF